MTVVATELGKGQVGGTCGRGSPRWGRAASTCGSRCPVGKIFTLGLSPSPCLVGMRLGSVSQPCLCFLLPGLCLFHVALCCDCTICMCNGNALSVDRGACAHAYNLCVSLAFPCASAFWLYVGHVDCVPVTVYCVGCEFNCKQPPDHDYCMPGGVGLLVLALMSPLWLLLHCVFSMLFYAHSMLWMGCLHMLSLDLD